MKISERALRIVIKIMIALVSAVAVGTIVFLALQISGRNRLYRGSTSDRPDLSAPRVEGVEAAVNLQEPAQEGEVWQEGDVRYQGDIYRYNEEILTFLFLGIDEMGEVRDAQNGIDGGQSDALFLLVLNPRTKEASVIGINRDTMTEIEVYAKSGIGLGTAVAQLCLQHGYGDGREQSCERSVAAVSKLFYNLPIHGYCSINMGAIPLLNDAVGGVTLTVMEDIINSQGRLKEGETVHLEGMDAYYYLHNRDTGSFNSAGRRLERQKQYLVAYVSAAKEKMKQDITLPVTLYSTLGKYMVTDVTVDEVSYLATQALGYDFNTDRIYSLAGQTVEGEKYEEFYVDEAALYELILEVFYEKVG